MCDKLDRIRELTSEVSQTMEFVDKLTTALKLLTLLTKALPY
jgi:hypothetical protein